MLDVLELRHERIDIDRVEQQKHEIMSCGFSRNAICTSLNVNLIGS